MKSWGLVAGLTMLLVAPLAGCGSSSSGPQGQPEASPGAPKVPRVAVVLGGKENDAAFSQIAADAAHDLEKEHLVSVNIRNDVADANAEPIIRQYAEAGYDLVIGWGLGFSDSVFRVAREFPASHFVTTGGPEVLDKATESVETWTYRVDELGFLTGFIAGSTQLSPVAVVDGEQQPFLEAQWSAFAQGLRKANPAVKELPPIYTGAFGDSQKASQATSAQIASGAKLIATNPEGYTPGVASAAKAAGVATVGMAPTTSEAAQAVNIGQAKIDLTPILREWVDRIKAGTFGKHGTTSSIANHSIVPIKVSRVAAAPNMPGDLDAKIADLAAQLAAGTVTITPWKPGQ